MKKTYSKPTIKVVKLERQCQILAYSLKSNVDLKSGGQAPESFDAEDIR